MKYNIINVFTVTNNTFNASLLNKNKTKKIVFPFCFLSRWPFKWYCTLRSCCISLNSMYWALHITGKLEQRIKENLILYSNWMFVYYIFLLTAILGLKCHYIIMQFTVKSMNHKVLVVIEICSDYVQKLVFTWVLLYILFSLHQRFCIALNSAASVVSTALPFENCLSSQIPD